MQKLTLGILTHDIGKYFDELLDSIRLQTSNDFELLIVINGVDTEKSESLNNFLETFKCSQIKVIKNSENLGSFIGTKQLIENSKSQYLSIIHGDDLLSPKYVETIKRAIALYPDAAAINFDLKEFFGKLVNSTGKLIKSNWTWSRLINRLLVTGLNPGIMPGSIINKVYIQEELSTIAIDESRLNGVEDVYLWQLLARSGGSIIRVPIPIYHYRRHPGQISKNHLSMAKSLGYLRLVNYQACNSKFEKMLCMAEIEYENSSLKLKEIYQANIKPLSVLNSYSRFRFINIILRRFAILLNNSISDKIRIINFNS